MADDGTEEQINKSIQSKDERQKILSSFLKAIAGHQEIPCRQAKRQPPWSQRDQGDLCQSTIVGLTRGYFS